MTEMKRFRGTFNVKQPNGELTLYEMGDVIEFQGCQYIATSAISGFSPIHTKSGWVKFNSNRSMNFTKSDTPPEIAYEGDHWHDSSSGKLFIYIKDVDTEQWVEL